MDLRQLEYFLAVVEHGGVTRAAKAIHISQPSLSQAVRALERDLGTELFRRDGRRLVLSPAGEELVGPARQVMRDVVEARQAVDSVATLSRGRLDMVAHASIVPDPLCAVLAAFRRRHPAVTVHVQEPRDDEDAIRLIREGRRELGFSYLPAPDEGLVVRRLGAHTMWFIHPPGTPADGEDLPLSRLAEYPVIGILHASTLRSTVLAAVARAGVRLRVGVTTAHREAIVPLVLAGAGSAFVSRWYADQAARGGAVVRRLDPAISVPYGLLHRTGPLSPAAQVFVRMVCRPSRPDAVAGTNDDGN